VKLMEFKFSCDSELLLTVAHPLYDSSIYFYFYIKSYM
jgi:hypothetical protein